MPKVGMEPIRRKAMVQATIEEIGRAGTLDVTVTQIAKRAGVSTALVHHYFGSKEKIFMAAMRHVLSVYGAEVRGALLMSDTPQQRVEARHRRQRRALEYMERQKAEAHIQMSQDPYLDAAS